MPYHILVLEEDIESDKLASHVARNTGYQLVANIDVPAPALLEAARSDWTSNGPQGCVAFFCRKEVAPEYRRDDTSPTGKSMLIHEAGKLSQFLDCTCGPVEPMLRRGQKVIVFEREN